MLTPVPDEVAAMVTPTATRTAKTMAEIAAARRKDEDRTLLSMPERPTPALAGPPVGCRHPAAAEAMVTSRAATVALRRTLLEQTPVMAGSAHSIGGLLDAVSIGILGSADVGGCNRRWSR